MGKTIGIQQELNEIAEALTVNGFEVTNMLNTNRKLDAIIYYNDTSNLISNDEMVDSISSQNDKIIKINAAKTNVDEIMKILNNLK